jgi:hypothetical protein
MEKLKSEFMNAMKVLNVEERYPDVVSKETILPV